MLCQTGFSQKNSSVNYLKIAFYNCENMYDTVDDKTVNDNDFLPQSERNWNSAKYYTKINNISHVIYSIDSLNLPAIIGLGEIENKNVLHDLVHSNYLKKVPYKIIHYESSDPRGIDVALMVNPKIVDVVYSQEIKVFNKDKSLREMLYAKLLVFKKDTLNVFVNHWKSRVGNENETKYKRILYASTLRSIVDSLFKAERSPKIIIMGDFNDNPVDTSIACVLNAFSPEDFSRESNLYNLFYSTFMNQNGSLCYGKSQWNMFDQIIISGDLLGDSKCHLHYVSGSAEVFRRSWMLYTTKSGLRRPSKTYDGKKYFGGYSDHLPVTISLKYIR